MLTSRNSLLTILAGFIASAIVYWPIAYEDLAITSTSFLVLWGIGAIVAGGLGVQLFSVSFPGVAVLVMVGYVLATLSRIVVETIADSSTHNLLPFELLLSAIVSFPGAVVGAFVILLMKKIRIS